MGEACLDVVGSPYRQHNPLIEDDMDGLRKFVAWMGANRPDAHGEIKRVFADGDYVMLHSHWHGLSDNPRGEAVVGIYRLENGKVVEHWDVIQPIPETAANNNRGGDPRVQPASASRPYRSVGPDSKERSGAHGVAVRSAPQRATGSSTRPPGLPFVTAP
jgi:predicted SnoaL-like aldol condensation-catalyzing enzyme